MGAIAFTAIKRPIKMGKQKYSTCKIIKIQSKSLRISSLGNLKSYSETSWPEQEQNSTLAWIAQYPSAA